MAAATRSGSTLCIQLPAVLDDQAVRTDGSRLRMQVGSSSAREVSLDASSLQEISTRGLGLLCALRLIAARYGMELVIEGCPPELRSQLAIAQIPMRDVAAR